MKNTDKTTPKQKYEWLREYQWKEGESGNPAGRPKNSFSIKDLVRQHLKKNPDDLIDFVRHFIEENRDLAWQMLEGRPQTDITSGGDKINPIPIIDVSKNNSNNKDNKVKEEDKDSSGGDISK